MVPTESLISTTGREARRRAANAGIHVSGGGGGRAHARVVMMLAGLALIQPADAAAQRQDPLRGLAEYIESARQDWGVAGLSVAIVKDDSVVFARGFGVREAGGRDAVDEHTVFAIGSNTKAFTAAAIGLLVEQKKMDWDDKVTKHLPEFQLFDPYVTREMTIRDVLSHRSGLGRRGDMIWYASPYDRAEVIRRVRHLEPSTSFRSTFGYQNIMFITAGEAAASAAGVSWDDLVRSTLLVPLGMTRSNTSVTLLAGMDNVATPHAKRDGRAVPIAWRNIDNAGPAGSINSSAADMTRWLRMLLAQGELDGRRVLDAATVREIQQPHTIAGSGMDSTYTMTHFSMYGLGFGLRDYYGRKLVSHTGGIDGMLSYVALMPEESLGIVVLTNTDGQALGSVLLNHILDTYIDAPRRDWNELSLRRDREQRERAEAAQRTQEAARVTGTQPSLPLEEYAGTYENVMYGDAVISVENGALVLERSDAFRATLEHWHYDTFRATWADEGLGTAMVTFELDSRGRIASYELMGIGEFRRKDR